MAVHKMRHGSRALMPAVTWAELCYKCQRPGHLARDCPGATGAPAWPGAEEGAGDRPPVCLRCGRPDCAAAGQGDFVRCAQPSHAPLHGRRRITFQC